MQSVKYEKFFVNKNPFITYYGSKDGFFKDFNTIKLETLSKKEYTQILKTPVYKQPPKRSWKVHKRDNFRSYKRKEAS